MATLKQMRKSRHSRRQARKGGAVKPTNVSNLVYSIDTFGNAFNTTNGKRLWNTFNNATKNKTKKNLKNGLVKYYNKYLKMSNNNANGNNTPVV